MKSRKEDYKQGLNYFFFREKVWKSLKEPERTRKNPKEPERTWKNLKEKWWKSIEGLPDSGREFKGREGDTGGKERGKGRRGGFKGGPAFLLINTSQ